MNWKWAAVIAFALVLSHAVDGYLSYQWGKAKERSWWMNWSNKDTVRVEVSRPETVYVPKIIVKRVEVARIDSTETVPRRYCAVADTVIDGAELHVEYNSPLPLSPRGFFSDISIRPPPRIDSVKTVYVMVPQPAVEDGMEWGYVVAGVIAGTCAGALAVWSLNN